MLFNLYSQPQSLVNIIFKRQAILKFKKMGFKFFIDIIVLLSFSAVHYGLLIEIVSTTC